MKFRVAVSFALSLLSQSNQVHATPGDERIPKIPGIPCSLFLSQDRIHGNPDLERIRADLERVAGKPLSFKRAIISRGEQHDFDGNPDGGFLATMTNFAQLYFESEDGIICMHIAQADVDDPEERGLSIRQSIGRCRLADGTVVFSR